MQRRDERERTSQIRRRPMLARPLHGLAAFLQVHSQASLQNDHSKNSAPFAARMTSICLRPRPELRSDIRNWKARSAFGEAGTLAERVGCVFSKSRASSLEKGFKNATPAWFPKTFPEPSFSLPIRSHPWLNQIKPS